LEAALGGGTTASLKNRTGRPTRARPRLHGKGLAKLPPMAVRLRDPSMPSYPSADMMPCGRWPVACGLCPSALGAHQ
jgi:hypothetical protein